MHLGIHPLVLLVAVIGISAALASGIIGVFIVSGKIKSVKILGIGYIVLSVLELFSEAAFLSRFIIRTTEMGAAANNINTVLSFATSIVGTLIICLFVHKNYGCKWIYFPLFAQPVVSAISPVVFGIVISRISNQMTFIAGTGLSTNITSLVTGSVSAIILIIVLYKNRKVEKIIPHAWIIRLITYLWGLVMTIAGIVFYASCLSGGADSEQIYVNMLTEFSTFQYIHTAISRIVTLALPIYILVMVKRAEKKLEETSAYIEE